MEGPSAQCVLDLVLAHPFGIRNLSNYMISAELDLKLAQPNPSRIYECPNIDECLLVVPRPSVYWFVNWFIYLNFNPKVRNKRTLYSMHMLICLSQLISGNRHFYFPLPDRQEKECKPKHEYFITDKSHEDLMKSGRLISVKCDWVISQKEKNSILLQNHCQTISKKNYLHSDLLN